MDDGGDDVPTLSADTLQLLKEFQSEKESREKQFEEMKAQSEANFTSRQSHLSMDLFGEDWNASQFWYTDETAILLAKQLLDGCTHDNAIAVVSAPSVYVQLRNVLSQVPVSQHPRLCLLEYDERFGVWGGDFVRYDFRHPLKLPIDLKGQFDRIICDPPFLSEDCQTKTALTARFLSKTWDERSGDRNGGLRFISCTGERMQEIITKKLYSKIGVRTTTFAPRHSKGLSNEFYCYANFECDEWTWSK